jgi:antitoxin ParD1/3/4
MNKHTTLSLDEYAADFIDKQVARGDFASPSDVVEAGLKLLEQQQARVDLLRQAIVEGEESGPSTPFDFDEFLARKHRERGL